MSILSRLKTVFLGGSSQTAIRSSSLPKVQQSVVQAAVKDQHTVRLNRQTNKIEPGIECYNFHGTGSQISAIPDDFNVHHRLDLKGCKLLSSLPAGLSVPSIDLSSCISVQQLPNAMRVTFLNLTNCGSLNALPDDLRIHGGILNLKNCSNLNKLPDNMGEVAGLNLNGCSGISALPVGLTVTSWIDITGTRITDIPAEYAHLGFRHGDKVISAEAALAM